MERKAYDLVVIGAGPGGYEAAIRASKLGMKTAVVERERLGGTCLNRGCVPTKTLIYAAEHYRKAVSEFEELGILAPEITWDGGRMNRRKELVLEKLRGGVAQLLKGAKVDVFHGGGKVIKPGTVMVEAAEGMGDGATEAVELEAGKILIATGSRPSKPPIPGLDLPGVVTSDELLTQVEQPFSQLIIIGGGVIGMEFASVYGDLGRKVTVIEMESRILPTMDREISQNLSMIMKKRGVEIHTGARVERIEPAAGADSQCGLRCYFTEKEQEQCVEGQGILVSIGRQANTEGLFSQEMNVPMNRGQILVDENYRTQVPGIYAIGDVIGGIQLAHLAAAEGIAAVEHMAGVPRSIDVGVVPSCIFTDPEIASVGLSADQAKEQGREVKTCKASMLANGKSVIENQERGFIKLVYDPTDEVILGAQLMCARATDLVAELCTAVANGLTRKQLAAVIRPHPTFCEGVSAAVRER